MKNLKVIGGAVLRMLGLVGGSAVMVSSVKEGFTTLSWLAMIAGLIVAVIGSLMEHED